MKNLLIVESPAKAKTIEKYLGKDFKVAASYGHIRDLPKGNEAVDIDNGFQPVYVVPDDKKEVVKKLKALAREAEKVWLATDEDREGEAISWHLAEELGLPQDATERIVFHEITKSAIQRALEAPRKIDQNLVNAQQARRVLDRIVGFELSPILWKKVKGGLSAGRVQSVAVRLIVEREREIMAFEPVSYFKVKADMRTAEGQAFAAEIKDKLADEAAARAVLEASQNARFQVASLETKPAKRHPAPPFTTSTLQQQAGAKLSYPVGMTMRAAQGLYEAGHITYMRTDSVNLSNEAKGAIGNMIASQFGEEYHQPRNFKTKSSGAQEAHEAIRPTNFQARSAGKDDVEKKLYDLIWKRAVASQMADAQLERTTAKIDILPPDGSKQPQLEAKGEVIKFDGFLRLYTEQSLEDEDDSGQQKILPPMKKGELQELEKMTATQRFTSPPARYKEPTLVKKLEELGIGRPSTYAPTISTIQKRDYVRKEDRDGRKRSYRVLTLTGGAITEASDSEITGRERNKLFPTDLGILVTDFLTKYFDEIMDYGFTASVEEDFDKIAQGDRGWSHMLAGFYDKFHPKVEKTVETAERASGERQLGTDPETGKPVIVRLGRYGPLAQIGSQDDPEKRFASLRKGQRLETVTLEEALKLFELPRIVGRYEDGPIEANIGRFGPYVKHDGKFFSLKGTKERPAHDPYAINEEEAIEVIEAKRKADREKLIKTFEGSDYQILKGRWGPYISGGKGVNIPIPKDQKERAAELTLDEVRALHEAYEARGGGKKGKQTKKKPAAKTAQLDSEGKTPAKNAAKKASKPKASASSGTKKKTTAKKSSTKGQSSAAKKSSAKKSSAKKSSASKPTGQNDSSNDSAHEYE